MRVGHGVAPLPVPDGTPMGGYADRPGPSSGVLHPLEVTCVTFTGDGGRFALVVAEVVCANADASGRVRARVTEALLAADPATPVADVWLCATHTHSGPDTGCGSGGLPTPEPWADALAVAAAEAARDAVAIERPLGARWAHGVLRDVGSPRNDDAAPAAVVADIIVFSDGGVLAVVPVHPTVLPAGSTVVSGDLTRAIRVALRDALNAPWAVVATGMAGDISTRRTRRAQTAEEAGRLGALAARQLAALARDTSSTTLWAAGDAAAPVAAARATLPLPLRRQDPTTLRTLRASLRAERDAAPPGSAAARTLTTALQGVDVAEAVAARAGGAIALELSAARLGDLALLGLGAEPYHALGDDLRARRGGPTVPLGYVNGHVGYLPDAPAYDTTDYEVLSSPLARDAAATAVAALTDLVPHERKSTA